jgi:hypothetical protein
MDNVQPNGGSHNVGEACSGFKKSVEFVEIRRNLTDSVVADFSKINTIHVKFGTV